MDLLPAFIRPRCYCLVHAPLYIGANCVNRTIGHGGCHVTIYLLILEGKKIYCPVPFQEQRWQYSEAPVYGGLTDLEMTSLSSLQSTMEVS